MYKVYCRIYQFIFKIAVFFLPWRKPELLEGPDSLLRLPAFLKSKGHRHLLIVTDQTIRSLGIMDPLLDGFRAEDISFTIYDKTVPNPTIDNIEEALVMYRDNKCDGIIGFGGGTSIDCAKGVGARVVRPRKTISQLRGLLKVLKKLPPLTAVPTTAGTGSETTLAAVITDSRTHEKYAINDISLIPHYAVLDPKLTVKLPPQVTAGTGMDALTHAVEAYIGHSNTGETRRYAREAVTLIFENLQKAYEDGSNLTARENMLKAAYYAGIAFTRAYVGNVHAIAHTLGGFYSIPHGLANAVILPYVLEYYGESAEKPLAELAELAGVGKPSDSIHSKALIFIETIKQMNKDLGLPDKIRGIEEKDIPVMADRAFHEANPLYPVPKILSRDELKKLYYLIKE